jgi:outer membrane lipoprotein carrier protein
MNLSRLHRVAFLALLALGALGRPAEVAASGLAQLAAFLDGARNGRATFGQTVATKSGSAAKAATGTFTFARPGKFRWAYEKPFEQLIVGDGERLWIFDRDLNQVIVRKLDRALGSNPAAILAGDNALEKNFVLAEDGSRDGLEFVIARPRGGESGFDSVRIGLADNLPRRMELKDSFGNLTTLVFSTFERNVNFDAAQFRFIPPPGADVVGE